MKKIMFNDKYGLTKAVLEGRKTQTRRVINVNPSVGIDGCKHLPDGSAVCGQLSNGLWIFSNRLSSTYKVGEEVAVAQMYEDFYSFFVGMPENVKKVPLSNKGWNNKMFVRADLMPHRIRITNVRVERLQDIKHHWTDCLNEGVGLNMDAPVGEQFFIERDGKKECFFQATEAFATLINKTCGKSTWASNPYVFVYDFELIK